ncbi:MAG: M23 family metallopeptidase [Clostridiales bacterium]|jgi:murein DD-endopeptidase MepM/ murein hydrolase activator NlpD|nr:M23 family metallopeptidase [Clostridiales bacterium]
MFLIFKTKTFLIVLAVIVALIGGSFVYLQFRPYTPPWSCTEPTDTVETPTPTESKYIRWAQFDLTNALLTQAYNYDVKSYGEENHLDWIDLLSYSVAKNYGNVTKASDRKKVGQYIDECAERLKKGEKIEDMAADLKYFPFYNEVYRAILSEFVGENRQGDTVRYGLKVFSPVAKNWSYSHHNDFGSVREYGFKRKHLGNDLMGSVGTPIIAVESGVIEAMGWNQYGGWRVGIRSADGKRYYYYAHLRKDHPFNNKFKEGDPVQAGDVIGYLGRSGYSTKEGVNNIETPHLHFGLQLIFDESQKEGNNQIWIDVYHIVELLKKNRSAVVLDSETKDWNRVEAI